MPPPPPVRAVSSANAERDTEEDEDRPLARKRERRRDGSHWPVAEPMSVAQICSQSLARGRVQWDDEGERGSMEVTVQSGTG